MPEMRRPRQTPIGPLMLSAALLAGPLSAAAVAQEATVRTGLWPLFRQSFDLFTIALLAGSLVAVALIVRAAMDLRERVVLPRKPVARMRELAQAGRTAELRSYAAGDRSLVGAVVAAGLGDESPAERQQRVEAAMDEQAAQMLRKIEPLGVIGNLGPLIGLAGTVWGMILAFTALGSAGGQASPAVLSVGIAKALFHTLLGLLLAIPCLAVFGIYRVRIDALCSRGAAWASRILAEAERNGPTTPPPTDADRSHAVHRSGVA